MQRYLSYKPTYPRVQTKFTSICNSISAASLHTPEYRQNLHQNETVSPLQAYIRVQTKIYMNLQQYLSASLHTPECRQNLHQYATVSPLQAYIPQSADKIYINMQQQYLSKLTYPRVADKIYINMQNYLSYKPTYPRVHTNFTSICSNSISATSLHTPCIVQTLSILSPL